MDKDLRNEILISDLSKAFPREALAGMPLKNKWYMLPYKCDQVEGVMLRSFPEAPAGRVRIPIAAKGRFAVHLGMHYAMGERDDIAVRFGIYTEFARIRVKFENDMGFTTVLPEVMGKKAEYDSSREINANSITEVFWKYVELESETSMEIEPAFSDEQGGGNPATIAWIRLVPVEESCRKFIEKTEPGKSTRKITVVGSFESTPELEEILSKADIDRFYVDCCRIDACRFPTTVGAVYGSFGHECGNYAIVPAKALYKKIEEGYDPLKEFVDCCHRYSVSVYPGMRIALHRDPPQHLPLAEPNMVYKDRKYWVMDRNGDFYPHAALAEAEVRKRIVDVFEDILLRYDVEGICIIGLRGWPWIGYEEASAALFREYCGIPIFEVDEHDQRFTEHRCRIFTMLIRELRERVDSAGRKQGRAFKIALDSMNCIENCRYQGLDIVKWAREGLIDELTLNACHCKTRPVSEGNPTPAFTREVIAAIGKPEFPLRAHIWPRFMNPARYIEKAQELWDTGIEGLALWDLGHRTTRLSEWAVQRCLGHVKLYDELKVASKSYYRSVPIIEIDGIKMKNPDYSANSSG